MVLTRHEECNSNISQHHEDVQKTAIRGEYFNQVSGIKAFGASRETVNQ